MCTARGWYVARHRHAPKGTTCILCPATLLLVPMRARSGGGCGSSSAPRPAGRGLRVPSLTARGHVRLPPGAARAMPPTAQTFGLYTSAGRTVCVGGRVGSQGHWESDAATFAAWGVDWVKMDWCGGAADVRGSYANMSKALNQSGRHIALNMCRGDLQPWSWIDADAQSWRVTEDHSGT